MKDEKKKMPTKNITKKETENYYKLPYIFGGQFWQTERTLLK